MSREIKVLYVCGTYAPGAFAGSELSAHELLAQLNKNPSISVLVVTHEKYTGGSPGKIEFNGVTVQGISHQMRQKAIREVINIYKPDVILTQLLWSDIALQAGESEGVPTVLRIPSRAPNIDITQPTAMVANSKFICDWVYQKSGRHCHFIFSTIDLQRVIAPVTIREPHFITMFNPIRNKGGHIFLEVARLMPTYDFAVVPGWYSLRKTDGSWDTEIIRNSLESQRVQNLDWLPEDIDLSSLANIEILKPTDEVANIFARTRLLMVPSQYEETLARVSIEAFANGIPVLGSEVGGLQDHVRKAGVLITDYSNPRAWVRAIEKLNDSEIYTEYSQKGLNFISEEFSNEKTANEFISLFEEIIRS